MESSTEPGLQTLQAGRLLAAAPLPTDLACASGWPRAAHLWLSQFEQPRHVMSQFLTGGRLSYENINARHLFGPVRPA